MLLSRDLSGFSTPVSPRKKCYNFFDILLEENVFCAEWLWRGMENIAGDFIIPEKFSTVSGKQKSGTSRYGGCPIHVVTNKLVNKNLLEQTQHLLRTCVGLGHCKCTCLAQDLHFCKVRRFFCKVNVTNG